MNVKPDNDDLENVPAKGTTVVRDSLNIYKNDVAVDSYAVLLDDKGYSIA